MITALDHVGIAVVDMDAAVALFSSSLGLRPAGRERSDSEMLEEALISVAGSHLQLLAPTSPSSTVVGRFLARRGPGIHHVGLRVDDLDAAITAAEAAGAVVLQPRLRHGSRGTRISFLDPRSLSGVLVEFVEPSTPPTSASP